MKPGLGATEKNDVIKAAYRQVFERDITRAYSLSISDLESKVKNGDISMKEFIRRLGEVVAVSQKLLRPLHQQPRSRTGFPPHSGPWPLLS